MVSVLRHNGDPRQPWTVTEIDRIPTAHRLRLANFDGSGKPGGDQCPADRGQSGAPDYRDQTPLVYYRPGEWKREVISTENSGVVHGIYIIGLGRRPARRHPDRGLRRHSPVSIWQERRLDPDAKLPRAIPAAWPKSGSSDIAVGSSAGRAFSPRSNRGTGTRWPSTGWNKGRWQRQVIDTA